MKLRLILVCCAALALSVGVATATAGGGNSANAKLCQKGGWQNLVRSDGSSFANQDECVSYGAKGGVLQPKPTCTANSENFSEDAEGSFPTTFAGGTIDPAGNRVVVEGSTVGGSGFPFGTHLLYTAPGGGTSVKLIFTAPVASVQLDAAADLQPTNTPFTLTAYDASNTVVGTPDTSSDQGVNTLAVSSTSNNIKAVTLTAGEFEGLHANIAFTNIVWGCAA